MESASTRKGEPTWELRNVRSKKKKEKNDIPPPLPTSPPPPLDDVTMSQNTWSGECPFASEQHEGRELANDLIFLLPKEVYRLLFEDERFLKEIYLENNCSDIVFTEWTKDPGSGCHTRTLTMTATLPSRALGPSTSKVTQVQTTCDVNRENSIYVINCVATNGGIPYGDNFKILLHYCIIKDKSPDSSATISRFKAYANVKFKKSTIFIVKGLIEKNSYDGLQGTVDEMVSALYAEAEKFNGGDDAILARMNTIRKSKNMKPKPAKAEDGGPWNVRILVLLLVVIGVMNAYLFLQLNNIEDLAKTPREPLIGERVTVNSLRRPPSIKTLEESLHLLKIREEVLKKNLERWREKFHLILESISTAETELRQLITALPKYESELRAAFSLTKTQTEDDGEDLFESNRTTLIN